MTVKQQQCLLCYMDLYNADIDGKYGPLTKEATRKAQKKLNIKEDGAFGPITEKAVLSFIAGGGPNNNQVYNTLITCLDAIKDLPEFKTLSGLLED